MLTTCFAQIGVKIKPAQNLLKFVTFDISNILISILMSKIIFMKYLPIVKSKLVPNKLELEFIEIWSSKK